MPMELIKELGRRIQKARKEKGLTQQELADLSHVSLKHVQGCERGVKNPSFEVLRAFCKVLNLSLDSLLKYGSKEERRKRYMEMGNMYYNLDEFKESIKYFSLAMEKENSI